MDKERIDLRDVDKDNIKLLKRVHQIIFQVSYDSRFYAHVLASGQLAKVAYYDGSFVGGISCRKVTADNDACKLYIMTLACLAPFRRLGIGTRLVKHILDLCYETNYESVFLHVQTDQTVAIEFYQKLGFTIAETVKDYYRNLDPPDAYVLEKRRS